MIDFELYKDNESIKAAFIMLSSSGILDEQIRRIYERLGRGDPNESEDTLSKRVRAARADVRQLVMLKEIGDNLIKAENQNA